MNAVYLCLGGNIGNRAYTLKLAISKIEELTGEIITVSPLYETEAWGVQNQQTYLNQCIYIHTPLPCKDLIKELLSIEKQLGRERIQSNTYESRTIDIDILFFNRDIIEEEDLTVPHPRLHLRKFVLTPLNDIASEYVHPILNQTVTELLYHCTDELKVHLFIN